MFSSEGTFELSNFVAPIVMKLSPNCRALNVLFEKGHGAIEKGYGTMEEGRGAGPC